MSVSGEEQGTITVADSDRGTYLVFLENREDFQATSHPEGIVELGSIRYETLPEEFQKEIARLVDLTTYIQERCPQARVHLIGSTALDICRGTLDVNKAQDRDILITNITLAEFFQLFYTLEGKPLIENIRTKYEHIPVKTLISQSGFEIVRPDEFWKRINIRLYFEKDQHYIDMQIPQAFTDPEQASLADALSVLTNGVVALEITPDAFRVMSPYTNALDILNAGPLEAPFPKGKTYTLKQAVRDSLATIETWSKNPHDKTIGFRTIRILRHLSYQIQGLLDYEYAKRISGEVFERIWRCIELAQPKDKRTVLTLFKETGLFTSLYPVTAAAIMGNFQSVTTYLDAHGYTRAHFQTALNNAIHPDVLYPPVLEGASINGHNSYLEAVQTALGYGPEWVTSMEANFKLFWAFLNQEISCFDLPVCFLDMITLPANVDYPDPTSKEKEVLIQAHSLYKHLLLPFLTSRALVNSFITSYEQNTKILTYEIPYSIEESVRNHMLFLLLCGSIETHFQTVALLQPEVKEKLHEKKYPTEGFVLRRNDLGSVVWDYPQIPDHVLAQVRANVFLTFWRKILQAPFTIYVPDGKEYTLQPEIFFWYNPQSST